MIKQPQQPQIQQFSDFRILKPTSYIHPLYFYLYYHHQNLQKYAVSRASLLTFTLVHSASPLDLSHPLQWESTNWSSYLICPQPIQKCLLQYSTLTIIIAPLILHILSQLALPWLISQSSSVRNFSKLIHILTKLPALSMFNQLLYIISAYSV